MSCRVVSRACPAISPACRDCQGQRATAYSAASTRMVQLDQDPACVSTPELVFLPSNTPFRISIIAEICPRLFRASSAASTAATPGKTRATARRVTLSSGQVVVCLAACSWPAPSADPHRHQPAISAFRSRGGCAFLGR